MRWSVQPRWECNPNTSPPTLSLSPCSSRSRCPLAITWAWGSGGVTMERRSGMNGLWLSLYAPPFTTPPGALTPSACSKTHMLTSTDTWGYTDLFFVLFFFFIINNLIFSQAAGLNISFQGPNYTQGDRSPWQLCIFSHFCNVHKDEN